MPHEAGKSPPAASQTGAAPDMHRIVLPASPMAVRAALGDLRARWRNDGLSRSLCGTAEQVLAEVMNNIVEHAQADRDDGVIDLAITAEGSELACLVRDDGEPMPNGALPAGQLAVVSDTLMALPEGGFGWFMIRSLTSDLRYARADGWNCLSFRIPEDV